MMGRIWEWLGLNLGKRAGLVGAIGLFVTLALGFGITTLKFTTSNADYLNKTDPAYVDSTHYESLFGGDPMAVLITMDRGKSIDDLFTSSNQSLMQSLDQRLAKDKWVYSDISPLDALSITKALLSSPDGNPFNTPAASIIGSTLARDPSSKGVSVRADYLGAQFKALEAIPDDEQVLTNPKWVQFLAHETNGTIRTALQAVFPNDGHALFAIYLQPNLDIVHESKAAQSVLDILSGAHFQNATTITTGVPAVLEVINSYLRGGILVLGGIAAVVMTVILLLTFGVRWRLLPFFIVAVGLIWAFGLVGYFGIPLTLATIAALPVLLGVGMDYAIQMHSRIEEEVVLARAPHPIQSAARGLGPALLVVTFDAVFAFAAMWFAKVPGVRQFGSLLVVGIIAVCVCSIMLTLAVLGIREFKSPTRAKDFSKGRLSRIVVWLGSVPAKFAIPLALASTLIFVGGIAAEGKLVLQTNPIDWLNPSSPAIKNVVELKNATGSNQQVGAVVTTKNPWSDQTVAYVAKMSRELVAKYPKVLFPATGIVNTLDDVMNMPGATEVPPTGAQVEGLYLSSSPAVQRVMVAKGGYALNVIFEVRSNTLSSLVPVVSTLEHEHPPPGMTVSPGGISIVGVGLLQNLAKARTLLTYLALVFVGLWLAIRLRSVVRSLLSLVPVLIAVGGVSLAAVALSIKLSPLTAVSGPLVVAVCTEFTSLMLLRFVEERNRGYEPTEALRVTASRTGRAFMVSGMTAVAGVAVVASSPMPLLSDFGMIVALNVGVALLCALVVLPPILVWADAPERLWVSKGLLRPVPAPIEFDLPPARRAPSPGPAPEPVPVAAFGSAEEAHTPPPPERVPVQAEPVLVEPEPVLVQAEPVLAQPESVLVEPEPVLLEPEPVLVEPEPVLMEPEPVLLEPEPVLVEQTSSPAQGFRASQVSPVQVVEPRTVEPASPEPVSVAPSAPEPVAVSYASGPPAPDPDGKWSTVLDKLQTIQQSFTRLNDAVDKADGLVPQEGSGTQTIESTTTVSNSPPAAGVNPSPPTETPELNMPEAPTELFPVHPAAIDSGPAVGATQKPRSSWRSRLSKREPRQSREHPEGVDRMAFAGALGAPPEGSSHDALSLLNAVAAPDSEIHSPPPYGSNGPPLPG